MKQKLIDLMYKQANPWGYRLVGEDDFGLLADEIIKLYEKEKANIG